MSSTNGTGGNGKTEGANGGPPAQPPPVVVPRMRGTRPAKEPLRRKGIVAEEAQLRARVELARALGDPAEERAAAHKLAQILAARDVEIDFAVELAFRTLASHDDPGLRHALAGWLEGLGEPGLAASELRKLAAAAEGKTAAAILVRIGVLHARAGDAVGAQEALTEAAAMDDDDPLPLELLGAVAAWAAATHGAQGADLDVDGFPGPRVGADAYVRAARRHAAKGDTDSEIENLLRAFELDATSAIAVAALMTAYTVREREDAADQVLRTHATALAIKEKTRKPSRWQPRTDDPTPAEVHARRRATALEGGHLGRALGAALDERLDAVFEGSGADTFDEMLSRASAYEPLAVRLELRAERAKGKAASIRWAELGRLLSGPLAAADRAIEALTRAVAADATNVEALHALRALTEKNDGNGWFIEALIRAAMGDGSADEAASRLVAARELAAIGESRNDALLSAWAYWVMSELDPSDERARAAAGRLEGAVRRHEEELGLARRALQTSAADGRAVALVEVARLARSLPEASRELATVLLELAERRLEEPMAAIDLDPDSSRYMSTAPASHEDDPIFTEALRVAERVGEFAGIARLTKLRLDKRGPNVRVRGMLVSALRRQGDLAGASEAARAFAEESATRWTCSVAWITAAAADDALTRGRAMAAVAPACGISVVATIAAVAAEVLADVGENDAARRAAEQAIRMDGQHVRALCVLARLTTAADGRVAQAAVERAMDSAGPSAQWCARLSDILEQAGDPRGAVAWARRRVALRPGEPAAAQALVDRAVRAGDAEALGEALAWLAPQPQPSREMAERLAPALEALGALDAKRAAAISKRALDVLGPRHTTLRRAIEQVADAARDARLRATLGERWIAAGAPAAERGPLLLELASYYQELADPDAELHAFARAAREGVDLSARASRIDDLGVEAKKPDAMLAYLETRAELRVDQGMTSAAADAFRDLGAALWDLADDRPRAVQAWLRAAHCDSVHGYATLRRDLATFADTQYAVDCLSELVERESDKIRSGVIATQAARAALDVGAHSRALGLAKLALERDPAHADALETAEAACAELARVTDMSPVYDQVARRARGRFGRRAAHHRAARFFEAGGAAMLALKHAAQAFIAVPSEGSTLGLLQRTATKAQRESVAVRTVEHVAELARTPHARTVWLLRAASMTARDLEGTRQKMDLLLKASVLTPSPMTLSMLSVAARETISLAPEDSAAVAMRLERAGDALAKGLEGPDGARIAITFVEMAMDLFSDGEWGWRALERAIGADADVDEYTNLMMHAQAFGRAAGAAEALVRVMGEVEKPYSNVGHALLRLVGAIAKEAGDSGKRAKVLLRAAEKESDNDAIVVEADEAVSMHGDAIMNERLTKKVGAFRRTEALRSMAKQSIDDGSAADAVKMLERATEIAAPEQKGDVAKELNDALVAAGRGEDAILRELGRDNMPKPERALRWAELARIRDEHGDASGAADALLQAATEEPSSVRWAAVEKAAEASGREHIRVDALQHLAALARSGDTIGASGVPEELRTILKRLARAEGARGSLAAAEAAWREVLEVDPNDLEADVAIEALLVARGSFDDLVEHLAERAARLAKSSLAEDKDKLRAVRLRRAAILEQRLVRLEDACAELEKVLVEQPGHPSALRWLADLYERAGEPHKALPALERLFAATNEELEYVTLGVRRVRAYLASGDLGKAQQAIVDLHSRTPNVIAVAEARVEVARASQNPTELGNALADLARISVEDPRVRSEMLVEAAQSAARAGDSDTSLSRAREAARLAPDAASTQLFARGLEYRLRGAGARDDALATIASLDRLVTDNTVRAAEAKTPLEPEDIALRAFLLAEAEDVVHGHGAGEGTLKKCLAEVGAQPLVALGLAERAARAGRHEEAYRFYTEAVYGNLLGLRRHGRVAMAAAESASLAGDVSSTQRFLNEAAKDPETRLDALRRVAKVALSRDDLVRARKVLRGLAENLEGAERAEVLAELARVLLASNNPSERLEGDRTMREAIDNASADVAAGLRGELESFRGRSPSGAAMAAVRPPGPARKPTPPPLPNKDTPPQGTRKPLSDMPTIAEIEIPTQIVRHHDIAGEEAAPPTVVGVGSPSASNRPPPLSKFSEEAPTYEMEAPSGMMEVESSEIHTVQSGEIQTAPEIQTGEMVTRDVPTRRLSMEIPGLPKIPPPPPPLLVGGSDEEQPIMSVRHPPLGSERPPPPTEYQAEPPKHVSDQPPRSGRSSAPPGQSTISEIPTTPAGKVAKARARLVHGAPEEAERLLTEALREGSIDAADLLDKMLKDEPARRAALIKVRRQAVELNPGNTARLVSLRDAARADQNTNYVRAIDHVLRAFDKVAGPLVPPPLTAQSAQPGMLTLLTRHSHEPAGEAFGVVWEGAPAVFAKTPAAAGMSGLERVVPGPTSALSRLYDAALRLLDTPRFALFHKRTTNLGKPRKGEVPFEGEGDPLSLSVALLSPPAAILSGDARDDGLELRWVLGSALSSVLPQNALVSGLPQPEARALWTVIIGAFGPPGLLSIERKDAQLADMLWQTLAPRTQRRLKELLATSEATPFELVAERAKQSGRRVGMFLTGDFAHAAKTILTDFPQAKPEDLEAPGGLEKLCAQLPSLADLLRLAVRPEYADARWHLPTPASQRLASGRFPPV